MTEPTQPDSPTYRLPGEPGSAEPLPRELDTVAGWKGRARLVRPDAEPAARVAAGGGWAPVYHRRATVPIESEADLDATSAYPRASRVPGVYDYLPGRHRAKDDGAE